MPISAILNSSEATVDYDPQNAGLFVYVKDADVAFDYALELSSEILLEVSDMHYSISGGIKDPFGNRWWISSVS